MARQGKGVKCCESCGRDTRNQLGFCADCGGSRYYFPKRKKEKRKAILEHVREEADLESREERYNGLGIDDVMIQSVEEYVNEDDGEID